MYATTSRLPTVCRGSGTWNWTAHSWRKVWLILIQRCCMPRSPNPFCRRGCSCVRWTSANDPTHPVQLEIPSIAVHAISRDTSSFPHECVYLMYCPSSAVGKSSWGVDSDFVGHVVLWHAGLLLQTRALPMAWRQERKKTQLWFSIALYLPNLASVSVLWWCGYILG